MIQRQTRTLVVDDNQKEGEIILKALAEAGYPARFVVFQAGMEWPEEKMVGIRTILMDLALVGSGTVSDNDRAATQSLLEQLLDANNGPWGLVTWTSHAKDGEPLYKHLRERLPAGLRPVAYAELDKEKYLASKGRLDQDDMAVLDKDIKARLIPPKAFACLLHWEAAVYRAAATVLHELAKAAESATGEANPEDKLSRLLHELAKAESGKNLSPGTSITPSLYPVLTPLLADCLDQSEDDSCIPDQQPCQAIPGNTWQAHINRMLHIDVGDTLKLSPGCLIELPIEETGISQLDSLGTDPAKRGSRIRGLFLRFEDATEKARRNEASNDCKLYLMDITPPCDHAQKKSDDENYWRRFMLVCHVPLAHRRYLWRITKNNGVETREEGKLAGDHLYMTPSLPDETGGHLLIANANMIVSVPKSDLKKLPEPSFRIREQLFNHILSWVGRHISRQGIVSLG